MIIQTLLVALGATFVAAVPPLEVRGSQFVNPKTGDSFQVVGVAYQPGGSAGYNPLLKFDPLSNADNCMRDAALMQVLGINTIRVYNLDPDLNHDACASIFNAAGMYMMIDVNSPLIGESLKADEPWTTYTPMYANRTFAIVESFMNYPNLLAFFSGNEVISEEGTVKTAPPYVRAVTRDLKNYVAKHASRKIPVGYSAADVRSVLLDSWNYFRCAENGDATDMSMADIFALNSYSWCGDSTFETSGYNTLVSGFAGTNVPVFYSEFGCNKPAPRVFTEIGTIYSDKMMGVFAGGIVYEYAQEANDFGLVDIQKDGTAKIMRDFNTLKDQYAKVDFKTVQSTKASSTTNQAPACDAKLIKTQGFSTNFTLPSLSEIDDLIQNGISPKPTGKIIAISDWTVKAKVQDPDGNAVNNLAVKPLSDDSTNTPGTNAGTATGSGASPSESKNAGLGHRELSTGSTGLLAVALVVSAFSLGVFLQY